MKKGLVFGGLGVVVMALLTFMLRLINTGFFQDNTNIAIVIGVASLVLLVTGLIAKKLKDARWFGLGGLGVALASFLIRMTGFQDNLTLFIVFLVAGIVVLIWGVMKK